MSEVDYKAGEETIVTSGCYSDYYVLGRYRVIKDFNLDEVVIENCKQQKLSQFNTSSKSITYDSISTDKLVELGYLEKVDYKELYLGEYGDHSVLKDDIEKFCRKVNHAQEKE